MTWLETKQFRVADRCKMFRFSARSFPTEPFEEVLEHFSKLVREHTGVTAIVFGIEANLGLRVWDVIACHHTFDVVEPGVEMPLVVVPREKYLMRSWREKEALL